MSLNHRILLGFGRLATKLVTLPFAFAIKRWLFPQGNPPRAGPRPGQGQGQGLSTRPKKGPFMDGLWLPTLLCRWNCKSYRLKVVSGQSGCSFLHVCTTYLAPHMPSQTGAHSFQHPVHLIHTPSYISPSSLVGCLLFFFRHILGFFRILRLTGSGHFHLICISFVKSQRYPTILHSQVSATRHT